ncbi:hypothetical protein DFH28DRAFT_923382 [Melampsora americana]|nr:hypothetical protein DFH28DRAFT_923382 [Melampsora americana]
MLAQDKPMFNQAFQHAWPGSVHVTCLIHTFCIEAMESPILVRHAQSAKVVVVSYFSLQYLGVAQSAKVVVVSYFSLQYLAVAQSAKVVVVSYFSLQYLGVAQSAKVVVVSYFSLQYLGVAQSAKVVVVSYFSLQYLGVAQSAKVVVVSYFSLQYLAVAQSAKVVVVSYFSLQDHKFRNMTMLHPYLQNASPQDEEATGHKSPLIVQKTIIYIESTTSPVM